jgi:sortase A
MATWRPVTPSPDNGWGPLPPHATPPRPRSRRLLRALERLLLIVGVTSLGYYAYVSAETALYQAYETRELESILASKPASDIQLTAAADVSAAAPRRAARPHGSAVGRLEIPRLGVSAVVRTGSDARTLRLAIGHIPGTAFPGDPGNAGLAAHRDTFFRRLGDVRAGDEVRVVTPDGTFRYEVEGTKVVAPTDVWVLDPTERPSLTLVTCYPFNYIGPAPRRFIVRAVLASGGAGVRAYNQD